MSSVVIVKDGFTVGSQVFRRGDIIDDSILPNAMSTKRQKDYYGEIFYTEPARAERLIARTEEDLNDRGTLVSADLREAEEEEPVKKPKKAK